MRTPLPLLSLIVGLVAGVTEENFHERLAFHRSLCKLRPGLKSCTGPFTEAVFEKELAKRGEEEKNEEKWDEKEEKQRKGRRPWWVDDDDFEYYMWRKYQREKWRRRQLLASSSSPVYYGPHFARLPYPRDYDYTYNSSPYPYGFYSSYPSYGGYYPSYLGGGYYPGLGGVGGLGGLGYGGYGGNLFNLGITRGLGVSFPFGGFGIGSTFGIGIG